MGHIELVRARASSMLPCHVVHVQPLRAPCPPLPPSIDTLTRRIEGWRTLSPYLPFAARNQRPGAVASFVLPYVDGTYRRPASKVTGGRECMSSGWGFEPSIHPPPTLDAVCAQRVFPSPCSPSRVDATYRARVCESVVVVVSSLLPTSYLMLGWPILAVPLVRRLVSMPMRFSANAILPRTICTATV
ncbi:hypothetical protein SCHPADRAFT_533587 [Schizopora paradoxa]|uniref:Uncharacterized protein n=1 Tax=Schizopora paradoxa TaxID=27342 RepID=A0A0H2REW3_9AGAM|nr:hypothetical protein SCHPADRAFT_533587 [Schizopora paradoxa]